MIAAELNASAFGSVPSNGSFASWESAYCGTNTNDIKNAQQQSASFNTAGDSLVMDTRDALAVVARMDSVLYGKGGRRSRDRESTNARIVLHDSTGGASALQRTLNLLGAQGWELVAVQGETYFFKRRKS